ncbi:hypothetical protein ACFL6Z_10125 [Pseudomonadota bacterium]
MDIFFSKKKGENVQVAGSNQVHQTSNGGGDGGGEKPDWERILLAVFCLLCILVAGIYCSLNNITPWDTTLASVFQISFGTVLGAMLGEKIAKS